MKRLEATNVLGIAMRLLKIEMVNTVKRKTLMAMNKACAVAKDAEETINEGKMVLEQSGFDVERLLRERQIQVPELSENADRKGQRMEVAL